MDSTPAPRLRPGCRQWLPLAALSLLAGCNACEKFVGPEGEIAQYLQAQSVEPTARISVPGGGELAVSQVRFDHVLVKPEGEGFTAVGQVDAEGVYAGQAKVSYIGLERVPFVRTDGHWVPKGALLPGLQEVGALLVARHAAEDAHDPAALERLVAAGWTDPTADRGAAIAAMRERLAAAQKAQPKRWIIRVERERAEVLEETEGATRLVLVREGAALKIAAGSL